MAWRYCLLALLMIGFAAMSYGEFTFEDDGEKTLTILENGKKILGYNYGRIDPPEGSKANKEHYWRSSYVHPLYGPDGEVMTQDFPRDHYHHRGLYWTWPRCTVGGREMDLWSVSGARHLFEEWLTREITQDKVEVAVQNVWKFDDDPEPKVRETVRFVIHPADRQGRCIDFHMTFTNICKDPVVIRGQTTADSVTKKGKGYGGFCLRPEATRKPMTFTTAKGIQKRDILELDTPWADISFPSKQDRQEPLSGVAIFQNPQNPGYPHRGWIFRHYGFLGASWPHVDGHELAPGQAVDLRYRLYVHRDDARHADIASQISRYTAAAQ